MKKEANKMVSQDQFLISNNTSTTSEVGRFSTTTDTWKPILNWPYEVSLCGRIRNINNRLKHLVGGLCHKGRRSIVLTRRINGKKETKCFSWHKLVANAFLGPCPEGMEIGHIDGNPLNNAASNLRYVTTAENIRQSVDRGHRGANRWNAKMTDERVRDARLMYEDGWTVKEIAAYLGVSESCIHHIIARRSWKQVA